MQSTNAVFTTEQLQDAKAYLTLLAGLTPNAVPTNFEKLATAKDWAEEYFRLLYLCRNYVDTNPITRAQLRFLTESLMTYVAAGMSRSTNDDDEVAIDFFQKLVRSGYVGTRFFIVDQDVNLDNSAWDTEPNEFMVSRVKEVVGDMFVGEFETTILHWLVREIDAHSHLYHGLVLKDMGQGDSDNWWGDEASYWWGKEYAPYLTQMVAALARIKDALDQSVIE